MFPYQNIYGHCFLDPFFMPLQISWYSKMFKNRKLVQLKSLYEIHLTNNIIRVYLNLRNVFSETRISNFQLFSWVHFSKSCTPEKIFWTSPKSEVNFLRFLMGYDLPMVYIHATWMQQNILRIPVEYIKCIT